MERSSEGRRICYCDRYIDVVLQQVLHQLLSGAALGQVAQSAQTPPLLAQVYELAKFHRFKLDETLSKRAKLDVLRNPKHRLRSRFLHLLDFLETGEICTIVGTVLDNATESVLTEPDPEKRLIRAAIYAQNGFVMLRFENYCAQEVELGADGLPRRNTHGGSDLRGVRAAAEKRGGTMTLHWENEWFTLRVLLPQKS